MRIWLAGGSTSSFCVSLSSPSFSSNWAAWLNDRSKRQAVVKTRNWRVSYLPGRSSSSLGLFLHLFLLCCLALHELVVSCPPCQIHLPCNLICFFLALRQNDGLVADGSDSARSNHGLVGYTLLGQYPSSRVDFCDRRVKDRLSSPRMTWYSWRYKI